MSPSNANPGAGGARVHGISQIDAASPRRNQVSAQSNPARSAEANAYIAAFDLLNAIVAGGGYVATVDGDILVHVPRGVPTETRECFYRQLYELKAECIDLILRKNGVRP
jgi:hypothetical protein